MTNVNTQYWKRVIAYFDRVEKGEECPDYDELLQRAKTIARHGQAANDRVAELEAEIKRTIDIGSDMIKERDEMIAGLRADVERLRAALTEIHLTRFEKGDFREPR